VASERVRGGRGQRRDVDDSEFGNDVVDDFDAGEGSAHFSGFWVYCRGGMFHGDEDALCSSDEVHGPPYLSAFCGDGPVGERSLFIDLERAEYGEVDVAAAIMANESAEEK